MAILGYKKATWSIREFGLAEVLKRCGLAGWLEIATDGLEASAKKRIANEIGAHYSEAVSAHVAAGEPEAAAQTAALAELGDPQEAALRFHRSHLTESEASWLIAKERMAGRPLFSFQTVPLLAIDLLPAAAIVLLCCDGRWTVNLRLLATLLLLAFAGLRIIPRLLRAKLSTRGTFLKGLVLSDLITSSVFLLVYMWAVITQPHGFFQVGLRVWIGFYVWLFSFRLGIPVWNKLRKTTDEPAPAPSSDGIHAP